MPTDRTSSKPGPVPDLATRLAALADCIRFAQSDPGFLPAVQERLQDARSSAVAGQLAELRDMLATALHAFRDAVPHWHLLGTPFAPPLDRSPPYEWAPMMAYVRDLRTWAERLRRESAAGQQGTGRKLTAEPAKPAVVQDKKKLPGYAERAYHAYQWAVQDSESELSDKEAYEYLREHGPPEYDLPRFQTWRRYLAHGRKHHGEQKYSRGKGRETRSVVRADRI